MNGKCSHANCYEGTSCVWGNHNKEECEHYKGVNAEDSDSEAAQGVSPEDGLVCPWTGFSLGSGDLAVLSGRGRPITITLVGSPNAGKTSLLILLYLSILRSGKLIDKTFAGSWTLDAWESLAHYCRWIEQAPPSFPEHTSTEGRHPGALHLALDEGRQSLADVLLFDAPGEWYDSWAVNPGDELSEGARWAIDKSEVIVLVADRSTFFSDASIASSRKRVRDLIDRFDGLPKDKRLFFAWTKTDVAGDEQRFSSVIQRIHRSGRFEGIFNLTYQDESGITGFFNALINNKPSQTRVRISPGLGFGKDYFLVSKGAADV